MREDVKREDVAGGEESHQRITLNSLQQELSANETGSRSEKIRQSVGGDVAVCWLVFRGTLEEWKAIA